MNQLTLGSPVQYQQGPLHNHSALITGLLLAEQLTRHGHYHLITSSALYVSAHTQHSCVLLSVRSHSASAPLMQCNLFIIRSVNVIGVSTDKRICDDYYSHMFGCRHLEEIAHNSLLLKVYMKKRVEAALILRKLNLSHYKKRNVLIYSQTLLPITLNGMVKER